MNLRGEYHTENVTAFGDVTRETTGGTDGMDLDMPDAKETTSVADVQKQETESHATTEREDKLTAPDMNKTSKETVSQPGGQTGEHTPDFDTLYPIFWGLQAYFSSPTKIFNAQHFATFKTGLESTLSAFRTVNTDLETSNSKTHEEIRKSTKRKRTADGPEIASSFNPKYLTSRELFDLEVSSQMCYTV